MAQQHLDRLTATDASFLANEGHAAHMHVGAITTFEGPPPSYSDFMDQIRARLHLVPRYRQKLFDPPLETGRPVWADDPNFNLPTEYFEKSATFTVPVTVTRDAAAGAQTLALQASFQACNERLCLRPQIVALRLPLTISPAKSAPRKLSE